ncbi:DUF6701 domain-containing protein [Aeromonas sp. 164P]
MTSNSEVCDWTLASEEEQAELQHVELGFRQTAINCEPQAVVVKACANPDCSTLYQDEVTLQLSPQPIDNGGWEAPLGTPLSNGTVTFSGGQTTVYLRYYHEGSLNLGSDRLTYCNGDSTAAYPDSPACQIHFSSAGLSFDFPTVYAGQPSHTPIRAVRSEQTVCKPLLTGSQPLTMRWLRQQGHQAGNATLQLNGETLAIGTEQAVRVEFNDEGVGELRLDYQDASVLQVNASFSHTVAGAQLRIEGEDQVAVIPDRVVLQAADAPACSASDDNGYGRCPVYRRAGEPFTLQAEAQAGNGTLTRGFDETVSLDRWQLLAPVAGQPASTYLEQIPLAAGQGAVSTSLDEVGVFLADGEDFVPYPRYQPESPPLRTGIVPATVGRLVPWDFLLTEPALKPACGTFSYVEQPTRIHFGLQARNRTGGVTRNYQGVFARGEAELLAFGPDDDSGVGLLVDKPPVGWQQGVAFDARGSWITRWEQRGAESGIDTLVRLPRGTEPQFPEQWAIAVRVDDNEEEGHSPMAQPHLPSGCSGYGCASELGQGEWRHGRLLAARGSGMPDRPLTLQHEVQYFAAGGWQRNGDDSCSELALRDKVFSDPDQHYQDVGVTLHVTGEQGPVEIALGLGGSWVSANR